MPYGTITYGTTCYAEACIGEDWLGCVTTPELDQILVPSEGDTYETWSLLTLFGIGRNILTGYSGFGHAPLHFITQRGPFQDGETPLDMRYDTRVAQIVIEERLASRTQFFDRRWRLLDFLRPNRSFGTTVRPLIYRKWLPSGEIERGNDMAVTNGSTTVTSHDGRFIENGLDAGARIYIGGTGYIALEIPNDYTIILNAPYPGLTGTNVDWWYVRKWGKRDLFCLLEQGPMFDESTDEQFPIAGYREALRLVAHDPFWYGEEQTESWTVEAYDALVFNATGAWFGPSASRWFFGSSSVNETTEIVYWGTQGAQPTIEIDGPAISPVISNTTVGATIEMDYSIATGEQVIINTLAQTVTNNFGDNLMPFTTGDVATFELAPAPQAPNRINDVTVSFGGASELSSAILRWRNRHVGI